MRITTLRQKNPGDTELGVVHAGVEGVNEKSYGERCTN